MGCCRWLSAIACRWFTSDTTASGLPHGQPNCMTDTQGNRLIDPFRVSVVIPTFNRLPLLQRALSSVYAQTLPALEVIVVDDGSSDGTGRWITQHYPQVNYLWQPNRGVSAARNTGLRQVRGDWVALLDSDDEWLPAKLAQQQLRLSADPQLRVCHTDEIWVRSGRRVNQGRRHAKPEGDAFAASLPLCALSPSSIVIHRQLFAELGDFDESLPACEDYDLWLRITCRYPVALVSQPQLIKYGGHGDQLSRTVAALDRYRIAALQKLLRSGGLSPGQRELAMQTLQQKTGVYANGAVKRGRTEEVQRLRTVLAEIETLHRNGSL